MTSSQTIARPEQQTSGASPAAALPRRPLLNRRRGIIAAVILLAVGAGLGTWFGTRPSGASGVTTRIVTVGYGTIAQTASATGTIAAANTANLDFAVAGRVTAVDVSVGQTVTAGQALATVDPTALQAQLDQAQATLDSEEAKLASDESAKTTSSSQIAADQSAVTAAQASVTSAQDSLNDATLTSTISGTVASLNLTVGQEVSGTATSGSSGSGSSGTGSAGASAGGAGAFGASAASSASSSAASSSSASSSSSSAQVVVVGSGSYVVNGTVDDTEIGEIQNGDQATITPEGSTTNVYGQVASVGILATQSSGVASFPVVIDVTGSPSGLYPGATADIVITVKELQNVLVVPTAAVRFSGGGTAVVLDKDGTDVTQPVTLGTASGGDTQVLSGLQAGDQVVERIVTVSGSGTTGSSGAGRTGTFGGGGFEGGGLGGGGFGGGGLGGGLGGG